MASFYGAIIRYGLVDRAFQVGDWDLAAEQLAEADRVAPDSEGTRLYRGVDVLDYLVCRGDEEAAELWPWVRRMLADRPPNEYAGQAYVGGLEMAALAGRFEEAVEIAWEGIELLSHQDCWLRSVDLARVAAWPVADLGIRARAAGDDEDLRLADERMEQLAALARESRVRLGEPSDRLGEIIDLTIAQLGAERGRMQGASDAAAWREVADRWSAITQPYRALLARWREAEAAYAAGDRERAVEVLRGAHDVAVRLGARPLTGQLEKLARRMRVRVGVPAEPGKSAAEAAYGLTPRELEVLALVAAGRTNRQIADELFISESTAGVHVSNILGKLGVSSRTEAASIALGQGLVAAP
jgi:DNA-binding CsgD family transcriptional regulator